MSYAAAGVDIAAAEENVRRIGQHVRSTHGPAVLGSFGAFAGLFHLQNVRDPVLVASTDGVGTKVLLGLELGRYDVLGPRPGQPVGQRRADDRRATIVLP